METLGLHCPEWLSSTSSSFEPCSPLDSEQYLLWELVLASSHPVSRPLVSGSMPLTYYPNGEVGMFCLSSMVAQRLLGTWILEQS